jgi:hypothetical protein
MKQGRVKLTMTKRPLCLPELRPAPLPLLRGAGDVLTVALRA